MANILLRGANWYINAKKIDMVVLFKDGEELHMTSVGRLSVGGTMVNTIDGVDSTARVHRTIDLTRKYSFMYKSVFYLYCGVFESVDAREVQIEPENRLFTKYQRVIDVTGTINGTYGTHRIDTNYIRTERTELGESIKKFIDVTGITEIKGSSSSNAIMNHIHGHFWSIAAALDDAREYEAEMKKEE